MLDYPHNNRGFFPHPQRSTTMDICDFLDALFYLLINDLNLTFLGPLASFIFLDIFSCK